MRRREVLTGFLAAMAPDLDALLAPFSPDFYITQHRGLTHSFFLAPLWALLLALVVHGAVRRRGPSAFRRLWLVAAIGIVSHVLLDWITSWGTMFLSPFDRTRFALDWTFIIDLVLSGILVLGLAGAIAVARRSEARGRIAARATLVAATAYVLFCGFRHAEALRVARRILPDSPDAPRLAAIPQPLSPDRWLLLGDDGDRVSAAFVDLSLQGPSPAPAADPETFERAAASAHGLRFLLANLSGLYRPPGDPGIRRIPKGDGPLAWRALREGEAGVFGRFARFPAARETPDGAGGTRVVLRDVRFGYLSAAIDPFTYLVRYDAAGRLLGAGFPSERWGKNGVGAR